MRGLLLLLTFPALACHQLEPPPPPAWEPVEAGRIGESNLDGGCAPELDATVDYFPDKVEFQHSTQLEVAYERHYKVVSFTPAVNNKEVLRYALVQCGTPAPPDFPTSQVIEVPIRRFTTENHSILSAVKLLGVEDRLAGVANRFNITEPTIKKLAIEQEIPEVGGGTHSSVELAMAVDPDVHFTFYSAYPDWNLHPKLWEVGVTAFPMADHMDTNPLGRAEWVKLLALLLNKERQANEWFADAEQQYEALRALTRDVSERPRVLYGSPDTRDSWEVRGERNHLAQLVRDAGGEYFWERGGASSWEFGAYEEALYRSAETVVWIGIRGFSGIDSIDKLIAKDGRSSWLRPVQMQRVHALDRGSAGAWTSPWTDQSMDKPHRLLADLIRAIHPEIAVEHPALFIRSLD